ncbi:O-antigen ligase family protein [Nocardioides sp. GCM10028917]|uniref:O-antigen ligase family protein n=1 Tax=Nocardioides sp. GCM10028917 TaxID=3273408 RepID=UPI0036079156
MTGPDRKDSINTNRSLVGVDQWFGWTLALCFASVFLVDVPMPLSRSGALEIAYSDFIAAGMWAWLAFLVVSRRWRPTSVWWALIVVLAVFIACFVLVEVVRVLRGDEVLQPVLILRSTLLPVIAYLALGAGIDRPDRALNSVVLFMATLTLWHLGEWNSMRMSDFLGNSIVYVGMLVMLLPVSVFVAAGIRSRPPVVVRAAALINMLAALVFPVWAGSRAVTGVAFVGVLLCFFVMLGKRRFTWTMVATAGLALMIQASIWWFNPMGSAYGIYRLVPPPSSIFSSTDDSFRAELDQAQRATAVSEMGKSDVGRSELWTASSEKVLEDPLVGDGIVYFDIPGDGLDQEFAAHNVMLEHLNAFGGIGFLAYAAIFVVALWPALRWLRRRTTTRHAPLLALVTTAIWGGFSLTQPTSLIMTVMIPYFATIGGLLAPMISGRRGSDQSADPGSSQGTADVTGVGA